MAVETETLTPAGRVDAAHRLLLWADSLLPDDVVTSAREWLAAGLTDDAVAAVAFAVLSEGLTAPHHIAGMLTAALHRAGAGPENVRISVTGTLPVVTYAPLGSGGPTDALDLTTGAPSVGPEPLDRAAIAHARILPDARALWRAWRRPPDPPGRRVPGWATGDGGWVCGYLVRLGDPPPGGDFLSAAGRPPTVAGWLQQRLDTLVRVYRTEDELPLHLRAALDHAALLWTAAPAVPFRIARDLPHAPPPTPGQLAYLNAGIPVPLDRRHDEVLPYATRHHVRLKDLNATATGVTTFRTDGAWVWRDPAPGSAPTIDPDLADHIDHATGPIPSVDETTLRRAAIAIQS